MTIRRLANHVNYISDSADHVAPAEGEGEVGREGGGGIMLTEKEGRQAINDI